MMKIRLLSATFTTCLICLPDTSASLFDDVPELSTAARSALVAHYDGRTGVAIAGNVVQSWIPVDGDGWLLPDMTVLSTQRGNGAADLITYDGSDRLIFDDTSVAADGRFLSGNLANSGTSNFTIFWLGNYKDGAPFATSGTYAYNVGLNNISHQRDDGGGGFVVEMYNGTTYAGEDITAYDGIDTVWSTVITATTHEAYANGMNLNILGSPANSVAANAAIVIGAWGSGGYDLVGEIRQMIIFESALGDDDRALIEAYLGNLGDLPPHPDPVPVSPLDLTVHDGIGQLKWDSDAHLLFSSDLVEWFIEAEATSPMSWEIDKEKEFFRLATEFTEIPQGVVLRTRFASDTYREIEYHVDTGELFFHGEQAHGLDYYGGSDDLWWCTLNSANSGSGLLEFLMDHNGDAAVMKATALAGGWTTYGSANYSFLTFEPLSSQKAYINHTAPASAGQTDTTEAYSADYDEIANNQLLYVLYRNASSGTAYVGVGGPGLSATAERHPPGDGSSNRDNGVRIDIALKALIPLSEADKLKLINQFLPLQPIYDDATGAYFYEHGPGF
ncbi:MAG: hypothetical protein GY899_18840 [Verrucomicrobiaceae bacterium]|nr:hypothetical protein [Verrucomicrobiaceae bacterium]